MADKDVSQVSTQDGSTDLRSSSGPLVDQPTASSSPSTPAVQIQVLQQGQGGNTNTLAMQALLAGQDITSTQLALANLPASKQQEVIVAAQQQLLQNLRSSLPPGQPIVVPQNVAMVSANTSNLTNRLPAHYVTPFTSEASQVVHQPMSIAQGSLGGLSAVVTTGYDLSQVQPVYSQQLMAAAGADRGAVLSGSNMQTIAAANRTSPQTVSAIKWLLENYETAEGVSLPRSTLYNHYLRHCAASKVDAVNAASFGKLIRSVFMGLKTRRLGTRGNSKYHYYGIRIKPDSPLNTYPQEDSPIVALRQTSATQKGEYNPSEASNCESVLEVQASLTPHEQHQQYLGERRPDLDQFPDLEWEQHPLPEGITSEDLSDFVALYREHCEAIMDVVTNLQFQMVENLWQVFWGSAMTVDDAQSDDDQRLPRDKLLLLTNFQPLLDYLTSCDFILYQCIVEFLIPSVLRPIPATLTQAIRNFAKSLEGWMKGSLEGYPVLCVQAKVSSVISFSQTLRRYTSLNHLAQAARAVLQNSAQINQMVTDLNRVDFSNVQEQASWVCQCEDNLVSQLERDFKTTLQQQKSLEQWADWLQSVVNTVLQPYESTPDYPKAARQFLLKWSFYSSMVIRDLTLRSAASFGSFHLIRLLYDEYMFYLIEHKVALSSGKTPIAIMTEFSSMARAGMESFGVDICATPTGAGLSLAAALPPTDIHNDEPVPKRPRV